MQTPIRCPRCGTEMSPGSPEKLCPRCLLEAGLESGSKSTSPPTAAYAQGPAVPTPEELGRLFPQLEILELLGRGGMGAVYKVRQPALDRIVALKILPPAMSGDPAFTERFMREARALGKLNHPNIVGVFDFGEAGGLYYLLMEFVDGVNLRQALRAGTLKPAEALKIVPQICDALQFAHDEGVVHRDIKPENILLDKRGRVKIADFGLAKLFGPKADRDLTGTHQVMGTPHYMAPEQIQGTRNVDHRADIYSLGVTFYEMLTGELPLGRFAPPSKKVQVDVRLDEVVLRTLEVEPEKRYQHASEVKTHVEEIEGIKLDAKRIQQAFGREYRSQATLFGIPLLHIASGMDPRTGKKRIAKGIIAIGDVAIGAVACGGVAMGGFCVGGIALGLVSFAGMSIGIVLALGGMAFGGLAFGGMAVGGVALGGMAVGYYAYGGGGMAVHAMLGNQAADPVAQDFFRGWAHNWGMWLTWMSLAFPIGAALVFAFVWSVFRFLAPAKWTPYSDEDSDSSVRGMRGRGVTSSLELAIADLLPEDKVGAVRAYRGATGVSLPEAVREVKLIAEKYGKNTPIPVSGELIVRCIAGAVGFLFLGMWLGKESHMSGGQTMFYLGGVFMAVFWVSKQYSAHLRKSQWRLEDFKRTEPVKSRQ